MGIKYKVKYTYTSAQWERRKEKPNFLKGKIQGELNTSWRYRYNNTTITNTTSPNSLPLLPPFFQRISLKQNEKYI